MLSKSIISPIALLSGDLNSKKLCNSRFGIQMALFHSNLPDIKRLSRDAGSETASESIFSYTTVIIIKFLRGTLRKLVGSISSCNIQVIGVEGT